MTIVKHVENLKGSDSSKIMDGIIFKVFNSAYGKDIQQIILTPIRNNSYCDLIIDVHYKVDKRKKRLTWRP